MYLLYNKSDPNQCRFGIYCYSTSITSSLWGIMDEENLKILGLIVNKLVALGEEDISAFATDLNRHYNEWEESGVWTSGNFKQYFLEWSPYTHSWKKEEYDHTNSITLKYIVPRHMMIVKMGWDEEAHIEIGGGSANKDIKREFVKLCRAVEQWEKVDSIRKKREKLVTSISGVFPDILDHLILEENYEEEDEEGKETEGGDES